ncbi:MAG: Hsp70 family protein, partial [Sandaracinaceae bacterium]|nr:Hsp70 family protein [Sandaracinaceae bacterium]
MKSGPVLGIDLGTTNSAVAVADGTVVRVLTDAEGNRLVPSVVSFHHSGRILVGYEARERRLVDAENTVYAVKRLIGRPYDSPEVTAARQRFAFKIGPSTHGGTVVEVRKGKYALAEISAMVLRELRRVAEQSLGQPAERAVITVPANFNELQRSATKAAGKVAGLDVLRILNEPTAAALAYGIGKDDARRVAVYDLGGGTFDVTVLELEADVFEVVATAGDTFLGGEDLDLVIGEAMSDAFRAEHGVDPRSDRQAFERLRAAGEWAKCKLSDEQHVELTIEELATDARGRALDLRFALTRVQLEALCEPVVRRSFAVCKQALETAGMRPSDVDAVVLVGGSTRMPLVRRLVTEFFGRAPRMDLDPDLVVCQGAAIHGFALGGGPKTLAVAVPPPRKRAVPWTGPGRPGRP